MGNQINTNKRIAVQLFGHLRTFNSTYNSFYKNLILPNNLDGFTIDIFIHTWDEKDHNSICWHNQNGEAVDKTLSDEDILLVSKLYQPKKIIFEKQILLEKEEILSLKATGGNYSTTALVNCCYTLYRANELRTTYEKNHSVIYDWVIVTRPDILFEKKFLISEFLEIYNKFELSIPQNALFFGCGMFDRGKVEDKRLVAGTDLVYFGNPDVINTTANIYLNWEEYLDKNHFWSFVYWIMSCWQTKGLETIPIDYQFKHDFRILRSEEVLNRISKSRNDRVNFSNSIFKFLQKLLKLCPYFLVKNIIK